MMGAPPAAHWAGLCAHADRVLWGFESAYGADDSGSCLAVFGLVRRVWRALWTACVSSCSAVGSRRSVSYSRSVRGDGAMLARVLEDIWAPSTSTGGGAVWPVRTSQVRAHSPGPAAFELSVSASRSRVSSLVLSAYSPAVGSHHAHGRGKACDRGRPPPAARPEWVTAPPIPACSTAHPGPARRRPPPPRPPSARARPGPGRRGRER